MKEIRVELDETTGGHYTVQDMQLWVGEGYRLVESSRPQVVFFGPYARKKRRWLVFARRNFVRVFWSGESRSVDFTAYDWFFTPAYDDELGHPRHLRLPWWHPTLSALRSPEVPDRPRFCNFLYSACHPHRERFFTRLSRYKPIDAPGRSMNNMPALGGRRSALDSRSATSWEAEKLEFLRNYKFTIAFENQSVSGYTSEKLYQPMLVGSIPIYWGNPQVHRDYNCRSFFNSHEFASEEELVERIIAVDQSPELYQEMMKQPWSTGQVEAHRELLQQRFAEILGRV